MRSDQAQSLEVIERAIEENRLTHAVLLNGKNLSVLTRSAHHIAGRLLGVDPAKVGNHPDFSLLQPGNKMREISVPGTRELIRQLQHSPSQGSRKVALVSEVDRMSRLAANAFLKTLEEPPRGTTILLTTVKPHALLDTIISRCVRFWMHEPEEPLQRPEWLEWKNRFAAWLELVSVPPADKGGIAARLMGMYGLTEGFTLELDRVSTERWQAIASGFGEETPKEEVEAMEVGNAKSVRSKMLAEVGTCLRNLSVEKIRKGEGNAEDFSLRLEQSVRELEMLSGLLEVNLNEGRMLEALFLRFLRIWSQR
jgi:DNA polymerase III subunit delta'